MSISTQETQGPANGNRDFLFSLISYGNKIQTKK